MRAAKGVSEQINHEEVVAEMLEQILRQARIPTQALMVANFRHVVRCLAIDHYLRAPSVT